MDTEATKNNKPEINQWATASFIVCIVGCIIVLLGIFSSDLEGRPFPFAFLCGGLSLVFGIIALLKMRGKNTSLRNMLEAIIGLTGSATFIFVIGGAFFLVFLALRGEPYVESHPELVISTIENNSGIKFPEQMYSLKAANGITPGVHPQYIRFIVKFKTEQKGVAQLRDSLHEQGVYPETPDYNSNDYDPVYFSTYKDTPQWFKIDISKGVIYDSFGNTRKNAIKLHTICVPNEDPNKIIVYMEGFGNLSLRKELNSR